MICNLSLIPIGDSYWVTATKIGSNYIKTFANPNDRYLRLSVSNVIDAHLIDSNAVYITFPNGVKLKFQIFDFDNNDYTKIYDSKTLLDIFGKVTTILTRNPLDRFKSGFIQKVSELYSEIPPALKSNKLDNVKFHKDTYFDLTGYDIDYSLLIDGFGITPKEQNIQWPNEWNKFTQLLSTDVFNRYDIDRILVDDLHTQPVYHFFYLILNSLPNWPKIRTLDINELDSYSKLIADEIGLDEYQYRNNLLDNKENWNEDIDYVNILKRVSNKRLYFDSHLITNHFENSPIYIYEKIYYDILNKKRYKRIL
jgi:hypothetical protein